MKNRIEIPEVKTWEGFPNFPTDILNPKNKNMKNNQVDLDKAFEKFKQSEEYKNNPTATGGLHDSVGFPRPRPKESGETIKHAYTGKAGKLFDAMMEQYGDD